MMGNILTFIRGRKLAGMRALQQQQQARVTNSTALSNGTGGGGAMQLVTQPGQQGAGGQNASSVKIWIQPSGEQTACKPHLLAWTSWAAVTAGIAAAAVVMQLLRQALAYRMRYNV
jgi:hypothetical protein